MRKLFLILFLLCGCVYLSYFRDPFLDIPNFHQVDDILYRGGQPNKEGIERLKSLGVKTVISLRGEDKIIEEKRLVTSLGMRFFNIPLSVYKKPTDEQVFKFLKIVLDKDNQPVFLHCESGRDRVGAFVALYRVVVCGWTPKQAYKEAKKYGFWPYRGEEALKKFILQLKDKKEYFEISK